MKEIALTQGYVALVDDEDFDRVNQHKWHADVGPNSVYALRKDENGRNLRLHRFNLGITKTKTRVDHKDHNGLNCQHYNLRDSQGHNNKNQRLKTNNTSGFKGVSWSKDK